MALHTLNTPAENGCESARISILCHCMRELMNGLIEEVELATAEWVDWFNHRRLYEYCGDIPSVELETAYYAQPRRPAAG
jgi:hypothetical protein